MTNRLKRVHDRLTPAERLAVTLAALSRDDGPEVTRLFETCPRYRYFALDVEFRHLLVTAERVAAAFAVLWLTVTREYAVATAVRSGFEDSLAAFTDGFVAGAATTAPENDTSGTSQESRNAEGASVLRGETEQIGEQVGAQLFQHEHEQATELVSFYDGFERFCQRVGMEPTQLLAWWPSILEEASVYLEPLVDQVEPDETIVAEYEQLFFRLWSSESVPDLSR